MQTAQIVAATGLTLFAGKKVSDFWAVARGINNLPGYRMLFGMMGFVSFLQGQRVISWFSPGSNHLFMEKHDPYEASGLDATSIVCILPKAAAFVILVDAEAIKEVITNRACFVKPLEAYIALATFGPNIVVSEDEDWKRFRKYSAPAFSEVNRRFAWESTFEVVNSLIEEEWAGRDVIEFDHVVDITLPITLYVLGKAAFGQSMSWRDAGAAPPEGHKMTFQNMLMVASRDVFYRISLSDRFLELTETTRKVKLAYEELQQYVVEMIKERQQYGVGKTMEGDDLLTNLLKANDEGADEDAITEKELISNVFMFLIAGHESTAHTLGFAFGLLALYPEEQDTLYKHICTALPDGRSPTYTDVPALTHSLAVFYETLRMFPSVPNIPKVAARDTSLVVGGMKGQTIQIPIPKGTNISINVPGLHYNPRYWKDPHKFNPSRFLGDWNRDAFLPFNGGHRACLGRRFSEVEAVCVLTLLVSRFTISVKEEPQFAHETFEERRGRVLAVRNVLTLTPQRVPLVFTRRS